MGLHMAQNWSNEAVLEPDFVEAISLDGFIPFKFIWNCLDLLLCNIILISPSPWIFKVKFINLCVSVMEGSIDIERKGCESIECWTHVVTLNFDLAHDLDLGFSRWNIKIAVSQEWEGRLTCNEIARTSQFQRNWPWKLVLPIDIKNPYLLSTACIDNIDMYRILSI